MRDYYHRVDHDIGSSGVRDLTMAELRELCGFELAELDSMVFHDSESYGGHRLRAALADRWTGGDVDRMMVTHGSSEAIYLVMQLALEPGDEIIVVEPAYQQLHDIAAGRGCRVTRWPLAPAPATASRRTWTALRAARGVPAADDRGRTSRTTRPGRSITPPSRRNWSPSPPRRALGWSGTTRSASSPTRPTRCRCPRATTAASRAARSPRATGWPGCGSAGASRPRTLLARMALLRDYIALYVSPVLEFFAEHAVRNADRIVALQREHAADNRATVDASGSGRRPELVRLTPPDGGVSAFVEMPRPAGRRCGPAAASPSEHRVLLVPGACFGDAYRDYVPARVRRHHG